eukprot:6471884-Amphidinium_carterae.1
MKLSLQQRVTALHSQESQPGVAFFAAVISCACTALFTSERRPHHDAHKLVTGIPQGYSCDGPHPPQPQIPKTIRTTKI